MEPNYRMLYDSSNPDQDIRPDRYRSQWSRDLTSFQTSGNDHRDGINVGDTKSRATASRNLEPVSSTIQKRGFRVLVRSRSSCMEGCEQRKRGVGQERIVCAAEDNLMFSQVDGMDFGQIIEPRARGTLQDQHQHAPGQDTLAPPGAQSWGKTSQTRPPDWRRANHCGEDLVLWTDCERRLRGSQRKPPSAAWKKEAIPKR